MNRLSRYLLAECTLTTVVALVVLTTLVLLPQVLKLVDLWVNKSVSISVLGQMVLLITPKFLVASLPMALLVGILIGLGRLAQDSELIVMKASGISLLRIFYPLSIPIVTVALISLMLNWYVVPGSHTLFTQIKHALLSENTFNVKAQTFNHTIPGLTIYVNRQSHGGRILEGLLIHDDRDTKQPVTLIAKTGMLHSGSDGQTALMLQHGSRHQRTEDNRYRQLDFATYDLALGIRLDKNAPPKKSKMRAFTASELEQARLSGDPRLSNKADREFHRRYALPVATLILGFIAIPLAMQQNQRSGRSYGFVVAILIIIIHFLLLTFGEAMAKRGAVSPMIGLWTPNLIMALFTTYLSVMSHYDRPIAPFAWLEQAISLLPHRLLRTAEDEAPLDHPRERP
uniref:Putative Permease YjgP/YjgQ family protein n=1 Tax=Magnetococcus massalia (strain MO-1) TaxID=451514 RepID=A0A1S7LJ25_MAGMO|nr:putative Permease YjgP/YjgQ family protein [Candidatus Magnetococcus massalia]